MARGELLTIERIKGYLEGSERNGLGYTR